MLGAAHALANPLTATLRNCPWRGGRAHAAARDPAQWPDTLADWYRELVQSSGPIGHVCRRPISAADALADFVAGVSRRAGLAGTLTECGVRARAVARTGRRRRQAMDRQVQPRRTHRNAISSSSMKRHSKIRRSRMVDRRHHRCRSCLADCSCSHRGRVPTIGRSCAATSLGTGVADTHVAGPARSRCGRTKQPTTPASTRRPSSRMASSTSATTRARFTPCAWPTAQPVWTKQFEDGSFAAGAAVDKDRLYVGDLNGVVRCLAIERRQRTVVSERWKAKFTPARRRTATTCSSPPKPARSPASNAADGKERWQPFRIEAPLRCSPTICAGRVDARRLRQPAARHRCRRRQGNCTRSKSTARPARRAAMRERPRLFRHRRRHVFRHRRAGGRRRRSRQSPGRIAIQQRGQPIRAAAAVTDDIVVYGSQGKAIYGLDPANGERKVEAADAQPRRKLAGDRRRPRRRRHDRRQDLPARCRPPAK